MKEKKKIKRKAGRPKKEPTKVIRVPVSRLKDIGALIEAIKRDNQNL